MTDEQAEPLAIEAPKPPSGFRVGEPDSSGTTLTISEASRRSGVSVSTIRRRLKAGAIPGAYKTDGPDGEEWRIPVASLDGLASESSKRTTSDDPEEVEELRRQVSDLRTRAEVAEALLDSERRGRDELAKTVDVLRESIEALNKALPPGPTPYLQTHSFPTPTIGEPQESSDRLGMFGTGPGQGPAPKPPRRRWFRKDSSKTTP